jgi:hypothetical protein
VKQLTYRIVRLPYNLVMAPETHEHSLESPGDLRTDYLLIAVGAVAALIALIYLLLT